VPKLILLKQPKEGVTREELVAYLKNVHGPRCEQIPAVKNYTLMIQADPEKEPAIEPERDYYDAIETLPVDIEKTPYDTVEIHEFETMEGLLEARNSTEDQQAADGMSELVDYESEIALVIREEEIPEKVNSDYDIS
jgi:hypothetical protein